MTWSGVFHSVCLHTGEAEAPVAAQSTRLNSLEVSVWC